MDRSELLSFLRDQKWAVEASVSVHGAPQAAVIGVVVTDDLDIVFDTFDDSRKAENLRRNRKTAIVIGWDDGRTAQIEGVTDEPRGDELARLTKLYFARFPDGEERAKTAKLAYFRVRPTWIRFTDFREKEPAVFTLTAADLREPRRPSRGREGREAREAREAREMPVAEAEPAIAAPADEPADEPAFDESVWDAARAEVTASGADSGPDSTPDADADADVESDQEDDTSEPPPSSVPPRGSDQGTLF